MERSYKTLFDLSIIHEFYDDGKANDFVFVPLQDTAVGLKNYKLVPRVAQAKVDETQAHGLSVSYAEVNASPQIPITAASVPPLRFGLKLHQVNFLNFTKETGGLVSGDIYHYTNVGAVDVAGVLELVRTTYKLKRKVFAYSFTLAGPPVTATVKVFDSLGVELTEYSQTLDSNNGDFEVLIDLGKEANGVYELQVSSGGPVLQQDQFYLDDELVAMRAFAVLDIVVTNNTDLSTKKLEISYTSREEVMKYFVVFEVPLIVGDVIEVGQTPVSGLKFSEVTDFTGGARAEDKATKEALEGRFPSRDIRLYESIGTFEYKETALKDVKLKKNAQSLISHLPAPSLDNVKAEAYIFI